jgi:hypothetical protein
MQVVTQEQIEQYDAAVAIWHMLLTQLNGTTR